MKGKNKMQSTMQSEMRSKIRNAMPSRIRSDMQNTMQSGTRSKVKVQSGMQMWKRIKAVLVVMVLAQMLLMMNGGEVQATLQANPNTNYTTTKFMSSTSGWIYQIRLMETDGSMGLTTGSISGTTLLGPTDNNIDVHLIKSTEYGAMAILSASAYGNPSNAKAITTTSGNATGVIINTNCWEWTASIYSMSGLKGFTSADGRYVNVYGTSAKTGDALYTCKKWHSASESNWVGDYVNSVSGGYGFKRGNGGIFSYSYDNVYCNYSYYGRAVLVCGQGF